ncbi:MAG TPA: HD domain-containing protein [Acidimicrobiales bacterium]|nr:HD domain-containing protein [Acidimicrobiales bacterium]
MQTAADRSKFEPFSGPKGARMSDFSPEYLAYLDRWVQDDLTYVPERLLTLLRMLELQWEGMEVNQLQHSLQTAALAERSGAGDELVAAALLHDIGKVVSNSNHPSISAEIIRPWVSDDVHWIVKVHQDFQGSHYFALMGVDPMIRRRYVGHPAYGLAEQFVDEWDNAAFDPNMDTPPLEHFEPLVRDMFSRAPRRPDHWKPAAP